MGIGIATGKSRAREAAIAAISSPLLESSIEGARGVVFNITGGTDLTLHEVNAAAEIIYEVVDPNANIIFGAVIDDKMQGEIRITVIATGFSGEAPPPPPPATKFRNQPAPAATPPAAPTQPVAEPKNKSGLDIPEFLRGRRPPRNQ
jgi:cell division protein FtsZ